MTTTPPNSKLIRVLIVDDSVFLRSALSKMIRSDPALLVVGTASNGIEALEQVKALQPDVITLDVEMPRMNGLEALQRIMAESPRPVIMISFTTRAGAETTLEALELGAFDYITKPGSDGSLSIAAVQADLIAKIKSAARSPLAQSATPPRPRNGPTGWRTIFRSSRPSSTHARRAGVSRRTISRRAGWC